MAEEKTVNPAEELKKAGEEVREGELESPDASESSSPTATNEGTQSEEKKEETPISDVSSLEAELQAAKDKAAESYELYIRAAAEMENTRRRCAQDVMKARLFAIESLAKNLIPEIDSLEKALEAASQADEATRKGLKVTMRQLNHALEVSGMKAICLKKKNSIRPQVKPLQRFRLMPSTRQARLSLFSNAAGP